ncbi:MAG: glycosyltransferase family 4 protein [Chloroflexi bacterium]|nr:glycosyltransferase family 4 protein [Chloroflexota bacterium]
MNPKSEIRNPKFKILICLTYYRPHISGLTMYVERLARGLARRGHSVTVLTSHFAQDLPYDEMLDGVRVIRLPVAFKFSKGVIQPGITLRALAQMLRHDVVSIHLPQAEAGALAFLSRVVARKPTVLTYHCDLQLPPGFLNRGIDRLVYTTNQIGIFFAHRVVAYTRDYAINSPLLSKFLAKLRVIYPPVELPAPDARAVMAYQERFGLNGHRVVGFAARFAEEKGIQYLMQAVPRVLQKIPTVKFLLAGENRQVIGENVWARLGPQIEKYRDHVHVLGTVPSAEMGNFFGACDVLTVPSINSTESFGLVQVEAMLSGCPVVASNLPGVREPVRLTRMGEIVPIKDARALADAIVQVLANKKNYVRPRAEIAQTFSIERTLDEYEKLFGEL